MQHCSPCYYSVPYTYLTVEGCLGKKFAMCCQRMADDLFFIQEVKATDDDLVRFASEQCAVWI